MTAVLLGLKVAAFVVVLIVGIVVGLYFAVFAVVVAVLLLVGVCLVAVALLVWLWEAVTRTPRRFWTPARVERWTARWCRLAGIERQEFRS